jgi:hypothetical protein
LILSKMYLLLIIASFFMSGNGEGRADETVLTCDPLLPYSS